MNFIYYVFKWLKYLTSSRPDWQSVIFSTVHVTIKHLCASQKNINLCARQRRLLRAWLFWLMICCWILACSSPHLTNIDSFSALERHHRPLSSMRRICRSIWWFPALEKDVERRVRFCCTWRNLIKNRFLHIWQQHVFNWKCTFLLS